MSIDTFLQERQRLAAEMRTCVAASDWLMASTGYGEKHETLFGGAFDSFSQRVGPLTMAYYTLPSTSADAYLAEVRHEADGVASRLLRELAICAGGNSALRQLKGRLLDSALAEEDRALAEETVLFDHVTTHSLESVSDPWTVQAMGDDQFVIASRDGRVHGFEQGKPVRTADHAVTSPWLFRGEDGSLWSTDMGGARLIRFDDDLGVAGELDLQGPDGLEGCVHPFRATAHDGTIHVNVRDGRNRLWRLARLRSMETGELEFLDDDMRGAQGALARFNGSLVAADTFPLAIHQLEGDGFVRRHAFMAPDTGRDMEPAADCLLMATNRFILAVNASGELVGTLDMAAHCKHSPLVASVSAWGKTVRILERNGAKVHEFNLA